MPKKIKSQNKNQQIRLLNKIANLQAKITALEEANTELRKLTHKKNEFVSMATHQIRGPLGAIKGYISLIMEGDYGIVPKDFIEPLDIIFKSTDTLSKTVNDFLDISRIDQGGMKYYLKDFNLEDLVTESVKEMKNCIEKKGLELKLDISGGPFPVHKDKAKLKHVINNLIDNSSKYTKTGSISVSLKKKAGNKVLFAVKDTGVGIKKETMPLLFQKFSRCTDANKANILGTGLGLYVAKKMTEAQNGTIWAESEGEGKGAQFYLELDLVK